ncbi:MAG: polysaccharide biosynthesis protein [Bacteroidetes bacterium]|jgi:N-acetylneuraminate synthase|nr:polysaccharide biosynthesis protein [Bacteroidota bacterium]
MNTVTFGTRTVGSGHPPYVIAEIGSNHNGDMDLCRRLIDAAAEAGADCVKFQSWTMTSMVSETAYRNSDTLREEMEAYLFTPEQHRQAAAHCRERGITFASTPFSPGEADLLEQLDVPFFKIASMDVNNLRLLRYVARKGRPMIVSTGMATLGEVEQAVRAIRDEGNQDLVLLHCVSLYPVEPPQVHLRNMETLRTAFDVPVGFSDHSLGTALPLAAIALGACVIEKHFTLDKDLPGWDHAISADPSEMRTIVEDGREVFEALGHTERVLSDEEQAKRNVMRRSLVTRRPLAAGRVLSEDDLVAKRPGTGVPPDQVDQVLGRQLRTDKKADEVLSWSDLAGGPTQ